MARGRAVCNDGMAIALPSPLRLCYNEENYGGLAADNTADMERGHAVSRRVANVVKLRGKAAATLPVSVVVHDQC